MSDKKAFQELITRDARAGKLGRRDFMRYAVAAGMSVTVASGLWTSDVAASTPKKGGTFRVGVHDGNTSDTHDPGTYLSVGQIQLAHTHRSYLTEITPENTLGPDMADSWSATPDAKTWTFELNKTNITPQPAAAVLTLKRLVFSAKNSNSRLFERCSCTCSRSPRQNSQLEGDNDTHPSSTKPSWFIPSSQNHQ